MAQPAAADDSLEEIVVTATLRATPAIEVPSSVTVLPQQVLRDAGQQSLEDVLGLVPNLNWAGDTSRPRYFQLRGIGELEQYQGAPNPSVGFLIDDIDFSGLGTAGTLYDIDQVDVLRGPQATRYGANALAGLIYLRSAGPTTALSGRVDLEGGDYNTKSYGAVLSGPVESLDSGFRVAAQRYTTDGYYHNLYLNRYDTNGRDELTLRGKWTYSPSEQLHVDLSALHVQIDNGYDAYAIDNSRNTQSDNPSVDSQHSSGASLRVHYLPGEDIGLTFIATYAKTLVKYGYDGDWGNPILWAPFTDLYNYTEFQNRDRTTKSVELRVGSERSTGFAWLVGAYANQLNESLNDTSLGAYDDMAYGSGLSQTDTVISSAYRARNGALFGELDGDLARNLRWSVGLRGERWTADYLGTTTDSIGGTVTPAALSPSNNLWGGHISLTYKLDPDQAVYAQVARGYKAQVVSTRAKDCFRISCCSLRNPTSTGRSATRPTCWTTVSRSTPTSFTSTGAMPRSKRAFRAIPRTPTISCSTRGMPRAVITTASRAMSTGESAKPSRWVVRWDCSGRTSRISCNREQPARP